MSGLTFDRGGQDRHYDMSAALNIERGRGLLHCGSGLSVLAVNAGGDYKGVINSMPSARTQSPDNVLKLGGARLVGIGVGTPAQPLVRVAVVTAAGLTAASPLVK